MASRAQHAKTAKPLSPDGLERALGILALLLLAMLVGALLRGHEQWALLPWAVWVHLATIALALALTPVMMFRRRGNRLHRQLGWVW